MELSWLEDFLALASCANFSRAAELRNMTQPALSRRIRALEDWIGASLFDRAHQPVALTDAGHLFRPAADEALRRLYQGREECRQAGNSAAAALRFAATHSLSLTFFPKWLRSFEGGVPFPAIQLISDSLQACEQIMVQNQAQFLLCHHHPDVPGRLSSLQYQSCQVGEDVLLPVSAPEGAAPRFALPGTAKSSIPYLAYSVESGLGRIVAAARSGHGQRSWLDQIFTSHLAAVLRAVAIEGRGIAWLPRGLIAEDLENGTLVRAGDDGWNVAVEIRLFRSRTRLTDAAEQFWARLA